jgi:hypothetical protein
MYPGQRQPPTHIGDKFSDLHMSGPSARECGPSGPATADPIFRSELPRPAPKPPHAVQTLDNPFGPSAYGARQSEYNVGRSGHMAGQSAHGARRSAYLIGRSGTEFFKEDGYPTPYPSQLDSPSHHTTHQHHNIIYQTRESEYFPVPRRPERNGQSYEPHRACINVPQNPNQWGGKQHTNIQTNSPILDQRVGGLPPVVIDIVREEIAGAFRDKLEVSIVPGGQSYRRPYDSQFDRLPYPQGTRIPEFAKFSGDQEKSTREHIDQFLAQLGELADTEAFRVRLFSLSLTGTAFTWYATLPPNSILSWGDLEQKFHEHFFSGDYELDLVDLVALRQEKDESVSDYIRRFRDTRNRCFQIHLTDKQLAGIAFDGLRYYLKEKLEGIQFFTLAQLHQRASACESRSKELVKTVHHNVHIVEHSQSSSDGEPKEIHTAEIVWPEQAKSSACSSLQPVQKKRQEEIKFTFNVGKCDKIFDELLKNGNIKFDYIIPPTDELKRHAYCKWHNSFSHATNDCNVFRRQIQSAINEG